MKKFKPVVAQQLIVGVKSLEPNTWNYNKQPAHVFEALKQDIAQFGFVDPIIVRSKGAKYEIIGGEHRWRAAQDLGLKEVPVSCLGTVTDNYAKALTIALNETKGMPDQDALGALLRELSEADIDMSLMPYTDTELTLFLTDTASVEEELEGYDEPEPTTATTSDEVDLTKKCDTESVDRMLSFDGVSMRKKKALSQKVEAIVAAKNFSKSSDALVMAIENLYDMVIKN